MSLAAGMRKFPHAGFCVRRFALLCMIYFSEALPTFDLLLSGGFTLACYDQSVP